MNVKGKFSMYDAAIVDWGIGGLKVFNEIKRKDPKRRVLYFSDSGYAPYREMAPEALADRILEIILHFHANGLSRVLIACGTACTALPELRPYIKRFGIEITGMIEHGELVDPSEATAKFISENWRPIRGRPGPDAFFTTGDVGQMKKAARLTFGNRLDRIGTDLLNFSL